MRLYAIGDIHGRLDLLERAISAIARDVAAHGADAITVTLGDYIDRGPDSKGVIDRLSVNPFPTPYVALKGNHETFLEDFLKNPGAGPHWSEMGGVETLASYGITLAGSYTEAALQLREKLPAAHLEFFHSLKLSFSYGKYFLCHAGVRPGVPLDRQDDHDLIWIRNEFLRSDADFGKIIVHGHTPVKEPEVKSNRINIDTGAFATGRLTCVVLDAGGHRFLSL